MPRIDVRTKTMSDVALKCRTWGHAMDEVEVAPRVRAEHHAKGQRLLRIECLREVAGDKCGRWREVITDMNSGEIIGQRGNYLDGETYLVQNGGGRLPRAAARVAYYQRRGEVKGTGRFARTARRTGA